jgi:hypothetical protein
MIAPIEAVDAWDQCLDSHALLSPTDVQFREIARKDPEFLRRDSFRVPELESLSLFPRQPWPLFAGPAFMRELAGAAVAVSRLVRAIPERVFRNDTAKMAEFYQRDSRQLQLMFAPPNGLAEALARVDLIHGPSGFQCAEINLGGNIGGIENCVLAEMAFRVPAIHRVVSGPGRRVTHRDSFRLLAGHVVGQVRRARLSDGEINVALVLRADDPAPATVLDFFRRQYHAFVREMTPPCAGELIQCACENLTAQAGGLYYQGKRVHAVIEGGFVRIPLHVLSCAKLGGVLLFNGPISGPLSDKRSLALLSEHAGSDAFNREERSAIERYIPWTRRVAPGMVTRHGERGDLERIALARQEELVLKKVRSYGGADVIAGCDTETAAWQQAVAQALGSGAWIVQDYVPSRHYLFQHGESGCCAHKVAWGPFVFGSEFAGCYLRVLPAGSGAVVNVARGGSSAVLLDVEDLPA